ncbi:6662_t:CDS:1, partial [Funneliformis caledonium]
MSYKFFHIYTNISIDDIKDKNDKDVKNGKDIKDNKKIKVT